MYDSDLTDASVHDNRNTTPATVAERSQQSFVDGQDDTYGAVPVAQTVAGVAVVHQGQSTDSNGNPLVGISTMLAPTQQEMSSTSNSDMVEMGATTKPTKVVDVSKRTVKDGNGKVGKYTGQCRIDKNESTGRRVHIPTGQGRMEYQNKSVYDGEWKDGFWHGDGKLSTGFDGETYEGEWIKGKRDGLGDQRDSNGNKYIGEWKDDTRAGDGSFTHHSGWTVEGEWEKDRCIECSSVSHLIVANYKSACDWAQQQDSTAVIPPLMEAIGGLGVDMSRFLGDARSKGWTSVVRFIEDKGVSGDKSDKSDQPALHVASKAGNMDEVKRLLEGGAEVDKEDKDGFTAVDIAILHGNLDIAQELSEKMNINTFWLGETLPPLHWAACLGRVNVVRELVNDGTGINARDENGQTPLHWAAGKGHLDVAKLLVDNKAEINTTNRFGDTPLHSASWHGHPDVVKFLVENKAHINKRMFLGSTPLTLANMRGRTDIVEFLQSEGGHM